MCFQTPDLFSLGKSARVIKFRIQLSDSHEAIVFVAYANVVSHIENCRSFIRLGAPLWSSGTSWDYRSLPLCSNLGAGISEGCFVFDFASLPLEIAWPI